MPKILSAESSGPSVDSFGQPVFAGSFPNTSGQLSEISLTPSPSVSTEDGSQPLLLTKLNRPESVFGHKSGLFPLALSP